LNAPVLVSQTSILPEAQPSTTTASLQSTAHTAGTIAESASLAFSSGTSDDGSDGSEEQNAEKLYAAAAAADCDESEDCAPKLVFSLRNGTN
jgi:hypothetical protein